MAAKVKITISIDRQVLGNMDRICRDRKISRSGLFEAAARALQMRELEKALREGYESMNRENSETAEGNLAAATEVLNET
jgi:metal-responsive CopG/Arc/MetJ family transcriptional regulator